MLKHQEVLEVSLMTSVSPYSNSDLPVASVAKIGCTSRTLPKTCIQTTEAISQGRSKYRNLTVPYLEVPKCTGSLEILFVNIP
jgi:hypothetical protein